MILNIAEGNGRYSELGNRRLLDTANRFAVRLAVKLDVAVRKGLMRSDEIDHAKPFLVRVGSMLPVR
jgi:hypothetical protein